MYKTASLSALGVSFTWSGQIGILPCISRVCSRAISTEMIHPAAQDSSLTVKLILYVLNN